MPKATLKHVEYQERYGFAAIYELDPPIRYPINTIRFVYVASEYVGAAHLTAERVQNAINAVLDEPDEDDDGLPVFDEDYDENNGEAYNVLYRAEEVRVGTYVRKGTPIVERYNPSFPLSHKEILQLLGCELITS